MSNIRLASVSDIAQLALLFDQYRQFYKQSPNIALAQSFVTDRLNQQDSILFVAENDERNLIGFCQIYPSFCSVAAAKIGVLYDLFVDANARKTGTGRALMLAAHDYATNNGMVRLDLTTAKSNRKAQALYDSLGWVRDEVFYAYNKDFK